MATAYFIDNSGSTNGMRGYWKCVESILYGQLQQNDITAVWNNQIAPVNKNNLFTRINNCSGEGGTEPSVIAQHLRNIWPRISANLRKIIIVTDGQVTAESVATCDRILSTDNMVDLSQMEVEIHVIVTNQSPNMSVGCSFTRNNINKTYIHENVSGSTCRCGRASCGNNTAKYQARLYVSVDSATLRLMNDIVTTDMIKTLDDFNNHYEVLKQRIANDCMGRSTCNTARQQLLTMQRRIIAHQMAKNANEIDTITPITTEDSVDRCNQVINKLIGLCTAQTQDKAMINFHNKMMWLLSCTQGALQNVFTLDGINSSSLNFRPQVQIQDVAMVQEESVDANSNSNSNIVQFECPISYAVGTPCIPIYKTNQRVLSDLDPSITKKILDAPLSLTRFSDILRRTMSMLAHPISLDSFKHLTQNYNLTDPFDRKPLEYYALCLGASDDCVRATNSALSMMFTGGRQLSNPDLYFMAITWALCHNTSTNVNNQFLPYEGFLGENQEILQAFLTHLKYRLTNSKCSLGMSGLATDKFLIKAPLNLAIYFARQSCQALCGQNIVPPIVQHLSYENVLKWIIVDVLHWAMDPVVERQIVRIKLLSRMNRLITSTDSLLKTDNSNMSKNLTNKMRRIRTAAWALQTGYAYFIEFKPDSVCSNLEFVDFIPFNSMPYGYTSDDINHCQQRARKWFDEILNFDEEHHHSNLLTRYTHSNPDLIDVSMTLRPNRSFSDYQLKDIDSRSPTRSADLSQNEWTKLIFVPGELDMSIHPATCRPLSMVSNQDYRQYVCIKFNTRMVEADLRHTSYNTTHRQVGNIERYFPYTSWYMIYVIQHGDWPTLPEFLLFMYNRLCINNSYNSLPYISIYSFHRQDRLYESVHYLGPQTARERFLKSAPMEIRRAMEANGE